jgi:hypothetical protein
VRILRPRTDLRSSCVRKGVEPRSPEADDPEFDLAWGLFIAEVKSITESNKERQLRLGLGQVLSYHHLLARRGYGVKAVLVAESDPRDDTWSTVCRDLEVLLV